MEPKLENRSKQFVEFVLNSTKLQNDFRKSNEFCDLILKSKDGVEINVHRVVVASACPYIRDMLTSGMKETNNDCIVLEKISGDILEKIVSFMYEGKFDIDKIEEAEEIIKHAPYLQLTELVNVCSSVLKYFINETSCLKYWRLSENYLIYELRDSCINYFLKRSKFLLVNNVFLKDLTIEEFKELLTNDRLPCEPEFVFNCAVEWARIQTNNTEEFSELFSNIIELIQVPLMREDFILSKILTDKYLEDNLKVMKACLECVKHKWKVDQGILPKFNKCTMPKVGLREKRYLALYDYSMYKISTDESELIELSKGVKFDEGNAFTTFHNYLFKCGGGYSCSCQYFCPISNEWLPFPVMTIGRHNHACVALPDKIYVCGGDRSSRSVEIFNFDKEEWMNGPRMNKSRSFFGLTSVNQCLYAVGGEPTFSIEMLDPRTPEGWISVYEDENKDGKEHSHSSFTKCISAENYIYCFDKLHSDPVFDTRLNKFVERKDWGFKGKSFDVCSLNDEIGIISENSDNILRFHKFKFNREKIVQTEKKITTSTSAKAPALVALYY